MPTLSWHHQFPYDLITPVHVLSQWQICGGIQRVPKHPQNHSGHPQNIYIFSYIIVKILLHNYSMVPSVKSDKRISQRQDKIHFFFAGSCGHAHKIGCTYNEYFICTPKIIEPVMLMCCHWGYCFISKKSFAPNSIAFL